MKKEERKIVCKHDWDIFPRPTRIEYSLGDFIAICNKCLEKKYLSG